MTMSWGCRAWGIDWWAPMPLVPRPPSSYSANPFPLIICRPLIPRPRWWGQKHNAHRYVGSFDGGRVIQNNLQLGSEKTCFKARSWCTRVCGCNMHLQERATSWSMARVAPPPPPPTTDFDYDSSNANIATIFRWHAIPFRRDGEGFRVEVGSLKNRTVRRTG